MISSTINLLPEDYIKRRDQRRANLICTALFAAVAIGLGSTLLASEISLRRSLRVRDTINTSFIAAQGRLAELQQLQFRRGQMLRKARNTSELLERIPRSYVLAVITQSLPKNTSVVKLSLAPSTTSAPVATKFDAVQAQQATELAPQPVVAVEVTGLASTNVQVAQFIRNLIRSPLLRAVDLAYTHDKVVEGIAGSKAKQRVCEFKVTMELRPNVDVVDIIKAADKTAESFSGKDASGAGEVRKGA